MLIAFLENNLNEDGSVRIPEPLQRYMFTGIASVRKACIRTNVKSWAVPKGLPILRGEIIVL